jgi:hypothetical protein
MERVQITWSSGGIFQPSLFELPSSLKTTADEMADTGGIFFGKINRVLCERIDRDLGMTFQKGTFLV